jgi:hypothetical protein
VRIENNTEKQLEENVEENMHSERFSAEFGVQRIFFCSSTRAEFYHGQEGSMFCNSVVTGLVASEFSEDTQELYYLIFVQIQLQVVVPNVVPMNGNLEHSLPMPKLHFWHSICRFTLVLGRRHW